MSAIRILVSRVRDTWDLWRLEGFDGRPLPIAQAWDIARALHPWGRR